MADAVAEDPSCPPVKGKLDSKTSIEKEGRKPENVYGLPLTGGREGVFILHLKHPIMPYNAKERVSLHNNWRLTLDMIIY